MTGAPALRAAFQFAKCCGDTDANGIDKLINRERAKFRKRERQQSHSLLSSGKKSHAETRRRGGGGKWVADERGWHNAANGCNPRRKEATDETQTRNRTLLGELASRGVYCGGTRNWNRSRRRQQSNQGAGIGKKMADRKIELTGGWKSANLCGRRRLRIRRLSSQMAEGPLIDF